MMIIWSMCAAISVCLVIIWFFVLVPDLRRAHKLRRISHAAGAPVCFLSGNRSQVNRFAFCVGLPLVIVAVVLFVYSVVNIVFLII